jgi:predicted transcriptional regulator
MAAMNPQEANEALNWLIDQYLKEKKVTLEGVKVVDLLEYAFWKADEHISERDFKKIKDLVATSKKSLFLSEISKALNLDLRTTVAGVRKLMREGLVSVDSIPKK